MFGWVRLCMKGQIEDVDNDDEEEEAEDDRYAETRGRRTITNDSSVIKSWNLQNINAINLQNLYLCCLLLIVAAVVILFVIVISSILFNLRKKIKIKKKKTEDSCAHNLSNAPNNHQLNDIEHFPVRKKSYNRYFKYST